MAEEYEQGNRGTGDSRFAASSPAPTHFNDLGMDTLHDGTALHAPRGELRHDPVEDRVQCHLCGQWHRKLGPHLRRPGLTADEYRREIGLRPRHPLQTPSLSERQAAVARALVAQNPRVQAAFAAGIERARSGELPATGTVVMSRELGRAELANLRSSQGRAMGKRRAEAFRVRREMRARELGYADVAAYLEQRYVVDGALVEMLARELGAALSAVVAEMDRAGIPRRPRGERTARAHATRRRARPA